MKLLYHIDISWLASDKLFCLSHKKQQLLVFKHRVEFRI